ncbi:30S ribosomal protein S21 [Gemmata palustris]|jgi:small subunit ribosomal protein S21|nr:30S ribosomal protein S21 [Gemmata palustris]
MGLRMRVHDREPIGAALRRFKKLVERSGLKRELRAHEYYEKPCEARSRKEAKRRSAIKKAALGKPVKKERAY